MARKISKWQAEDGMLFDTLHECEGHEVKQIRFRQMEKHFGFEFVDFHGEQMLDFIEKYTKGWK